MPKAAGQEALTQLLTAFRQAAGDDTTRPTWNTQRVLHRMYYERTMRQGDAPIKVQHLSGREIGVNVKYLAKPFGIKYKLNGFELGGCHPFQIRRVYILFQKGWRDID